ncbi:MULTISPECIES: glycosyltransferase family 2 protein [Blautia]|uniref:glycosyltransferase family 2 protein n=1 Tax=Blautia TaxID=572511 RepID=UPI000BA33289|nr:MULTISPECIES: glycosyltransferase family 2 protein [Blautia]
MDTIRTTQDVLVSIIIATYHRDNELHEALISLTKQTYKYIDVIVVDDNADTEWNATVASHIERIRRENDLSILYIKNECNLGSAATRNRGIKAAKGKYITFLDDDDVYLPRKIEMQLKDIIAVNADYGLTDLYLYNEKEEVIDKRIRSYIKNTSTKELMRYHLLYHMTGTDTLMFKTEYLRKIGGFPGSDIGDEFYLMKEAVLGGGKFVYSPHCYVKAYVHTGETAGLSSGQRKIDGENNLYEEKKRYFNFLSKKDIRYVEMRHYAVIAFAELRTKRYGAFVLDAVKAFSSSPIACVYMFLEHR